MREIPQPDGCFLGRSPSMFNEGITNVDLQMPSATFGGDESWLLTLSRAVTKMLARFYWRQPVRLVGMGDTEMTYEQQALCDAFKDAKARGLVDWKFFFSAAGGEAPSDDVCREINQVERALNNGDFLPLVDWADGDFRS